MSIKAQFMIFDGILILYTWIWFEVIYLVTISLIIIIWNEKVKVEHQLGSCDNFGKIVGTWCLQFYNFKYDHI